MQIQTQRLQKCIGNGCIGCFEVRTCYISSDGLNGQMDIEAAYFLNISFGVQGLEANLAFLTPKTTPADYWSFE